LLDQQPHHLFQGSYLLLQKINPFLLLVILGTFLQGGFLLAKILNFAEAHLKGRASRRQGSSGHFVR